MATRWPPRHRTARQRLIATTCGGVGVVAAAADEAFTALLIELPAAPVGLLATLVAGVHRVAGGAGGVDQIRPGVIAELVLEPPEDGGGYHRRECDEHQ